MKQIFYIATLFISTLNCSMNDEELQKAFDEVSQNIAQARAAAQAARETCQDIQKNIDKIKNLSSHDEAVKQLDGKNGSSGN